MGLWTLFFMLIGGFVLLLIGAGITRAIFSIGKIVRFLEVTAQELRARNMADGVYDRLHLDEQGARDLNQLLPDEYEQD